MAGPDGDGRDFGCLFALMKTHTKTFFILFLNVVNSCQFILPLRIHGTGIFTYIWLICMGNVGKYTSPMDPLGSGQKCWNVSTHAFWRDGRRDPRPVQVFFFPDRCAFPSQLKGDFGRQKVHGIYFFPGHLRISQWYGWWMLMGKILHQYYIVYWIQNLSSFLSAKRRILFHQQSTMISLWI